MQVRLPIFCAGLSRPPDQFVGTVHSVDTGIGFSTSRPGSPFAPFPGGVGGNVSKFGMLFLVTALCLGCNNNYKLTETKSNSVTGSGSAGGPGSTQTVLKTLQPALAVRGLACLMCHADIQANIITDFGYGNTWFMGGTTPFDQVSPDAQQSWYNNDDSTWQTAKQIVGTVYVPDVLVNLSAMTLIGQPTAAPITLKEFMSVSYVPQNDYDGNYASQSMAENIHPPSSAPGPVESISQVVIRAPTTAEIAGLDTAFFAGPVGFERVGSGGRAQLQVVSGTGGAYVTNIAGQTLECSNSDILVNGNLFLNSLTVDAPNGCRIYVTGTVFVQNAITYTNGTNENLQITSARAIVMGIGISELNNRLMVDHRTIQLAAADYMTLATQVMADANMIGVLKDAQDDQGDPTINFTGLLLNAPIVHSRYLGSVKGTIVAETALFRLGQFNFQFDPVFTTVNVFPLLPTSILTAK